MSRFQNGKSSRRSFKRACIASGLLLIGLAVAVMPSANASEDAKQIYLLGAISSMAAVIPPPGTYYGNINLYYDANASIPASNSIPLRELGNVTTTADVELDVKLFAEVPVIQWVAPRKFLGGSFGVGSLFPIMWQDISVDVSVLQELSVPTGETFQRGRNFGLDENVFSFGDPQPFAFIGWNRGNWHWKLVSLLNVPIGQYDDDNLANSGFNRWAYDIHGAVTWFDPQIGLDISTNAGFTFNGENRDTNYKTGTEFHVEFAALQQVSKD